MRMHILAATALSLIAATPALAAGGSGALTVKYADLDLDSAAGQATLKARIDNAARRLCANEQQTGTRIVSQVCISDVRNQVLAQVEVSRNRVGKGG